MTVSTPCRVPTSPPESRWAVRTLGQGSWGRTEGHGGQPRHLQPCCPHRLYRQPYGALPSASQAWLKCPLGTARQADRHSLGRGLCSALRDRVTTGTQSSWTVTRLPAPPRPPSPVSPSSSPFWEAEILSIFLNVLSVSSQPPWPRPRPRQAPVHAQDDVRRACNLRGACVPVPCAGAHRPHLCRQVHWPRITPPSQSLAQKWGRAYQVHQAHTALPRGAVIGEGRRSPGRPEGTEAHTLNGTLMQIRTQ